MVDVSPVILDDTYSSSSGTFVDSGVEMSVSLREVDKVYTSTPSRDCGSVSVYV